MRALKITNSITRRDEKSLEKYLGDISKYGVPTPEEELDLFRRFKNGEEDALSEILNHNLRFVVSVAKQYQLPGLWLGDLINEGNIGLIIAARRFDETKGFKFISYAVWWIRQSIIKAINEKGRKIRLPSNHLAISTKVKGALRKFLQEMEREPSIAELAEATGLREHMVQKNLEMYKKCRSLDAPVEDGGETALSHFMEDSKMVRPDFELAVRESQKQEVEDLLTRLPSKEATVISMYYGIGRKYPMTLNDISEHIGISRERARQIKDKGLKKLRNICKNLEPELQLSY